MGRTSHRPAVAPAPPAAPSEPLGAPRGSVRGVLTLTLSVTVWILVLADRLVPDYLYQTVYLAVLFYFGARSSPGTPGAKARAPLRLPKWFIRAFVIGGFAAVYLFLQSTGRAVPVALSSLLPVLIGYAAGAVVEKAVETLAHARPRGVALFGHVRAVLAILFVGALCVAAVLDFTLPFLPQLLAALELVVAFYFGSRAG